ncbi:MAG: ferrous iron transport protein A [Endomicrobium sp.]|nr:ferrous iron transport protein A [Endomicrobium sp.]
MNFKTIIKQIYKYLHKHWIRAHFQKFKSFNKCLHYNGTIKLSEAVPGIYKFSTTYCNDKLTHRLSELGFVTNEKITVIENRNNKGGVMIKIKNSKIVLNHRVADKILLKGNNYDSQRAHSSCYSRQSKYRKIHNF